MATSSLLAKASQLLAEGNVISIPTETVYGLAADATLDVGVARIYEIKERPTFNPLILHVANAETAFQWGQFSPIARHLAQTFWTPGQPSHRPLTLIVPLPPKSPVSKLVTAGLDTLAIRVPWHPLTTQLLQKYPRPLAAPSANLSTKVSATTASIVQETLGSRVPLVLDGGPCTVGVESTIVDTTQEPFVILRYGGTTVEELTSVLGYAPQSVSEGPIRAPGMMKKHYSPSLPVHLNRTQPTLGSAFLGFGEISFGPYNLSPSGDLVEAAANLFRMLHELDDPSRFQAIDIAPIPAVGLGLAIRDRLERAAASD